MEFVDKQLDELKKLWRHKRQLAFQGLNLAMIVLSALMIWKSLMVITKSESPVVVVLRQAISEGVSSPVNVFCTLKVFDLLYNSTEWLCLAIWM